MSPWYNVAMLDKSDKEFIKKVVKETVREETKGFVTKDEFRSEISKLATKEDLSREIEGLARVSQEGFDDVDRRFDGVYSRLDTLDTKMDRLTAVVERDHAYEIGRLRKDVDKLKQQNGVA